MLIVCFIEDFNKLLSFVRILLFKIFDFNKPCMRKAHDLHPSGYHDLHPSGYHRPLRSSFY